MQVATMLADHKQIDKRTTCGTKTEAPPWDGKQRKVSFVLEQLNILPDKTFKKGYFKYIRAQLFKTNDVVS